MPVIVHLGYPKAASTNLQREVFAKSSNVVNLGLMSIGNVAEGGSTQGSKISGTYLSDLRVEGFYEAILKKPFLSILNKEIIEEWREIKDRYYDPDKPLIISHEGFLSARFSNPSIKEKVSKVFAALDRDDLKVLVIIRRQDSLLASLYRDHPFDPVLLGRKQAPVSFKKWVQKDAAETFHSHHESLNYYSLFRELTHYVAPEKILMLPLEMANNNLNHFAELLSQHCCVEKNIVEEAFSKNNHNSGISFPANRYRIIRAQILPLITLLKPVKKLLKPVDCRVLDFLKRTGSADRVRIDKELSVHFQETFGEENRLLCRELGVRLDELGYPMSK